MLSYRHAFHAGNHADVLKHAVLTLIIEYMQQKDKPFVYIDTHAGAGRYDLQTAWAQKNREFETGILPLWQQHDLPPALLTYIDIVKSMNPAGRLLTYPGSPWLVQQLLRKQDKARLFELHSSDFRILQTFMAARRNIKAENSDGLQALKALLPPVERRAVILMDPSYEIKSDFVQVVSALKDAYQRFPTGVYALWYPVLKRAFVNQLEKGLVTGSVRNVLLAELVVMPEQALGMAGSGVIVINPPWTLQESLQEILPYLADHLGNNGTGKYRIEMLVPE